MSRERHVLVAAGMALLLVSAPAMALTMRVVPVWLARVLPYAMPTVLPGFFVAALGGGNVHSYSRVLVCAASYVFWFGMAYGALGLLGRWRRGTA